MAAAAGAPGPRPERTRLIKLREGRRIPTTLDRGEVQAILAGHDRLRDRLLLSMLAESGLRVGEALGLRHEDIDVAARLIAVVPWVNVNRARAKGAHRMVPVPASLIRLYSDYPHIE